MIVDKFTKAVMALLAVSLFIIALNSWIAPTKAYADTHAIAMAVYAVVDAVNGIDCSK